MRVWSYGLGFTLALGLGLGGGCSATGSKASSIGLGGSGTGTTTTGAGNGTGTGGTSSTGMGGGSTTGLLDASVPDGLASCTTFTAQTQQAPAAMMIVLQRSSSMINSGKWPASQTAIVKAIDEDVFDTMSLGFAWGSPRATRAPPTASARVSAPTLRRLAAVPASPAASR